MTPLEGPPNRGYADWQRLDNWDSGLLFGANTGVINTATALPTLDVSRYAYLGTFISCGTGPTNVFLNWFLDAGLSISAGFRFLQLYPSIANQCQARLPNLGPFVTGHFVGAGGGNYSLFANLFGTNRFHPLEFIPQQPVLIPWQNSGSIAFGSAWTVYPSDYYAGPVMVDINIPSSKSWVVDPQYLRADGTWIGFWQQFSTGGDDVFTFVTPPGAWRINLVNNTGVADNINLSCWYPITGAT